MTLGQYTLAISIVGVLSIFSNFGIKPIMAREIAKSRSKTSLYLGNAIGIKYFISFPILILLCFIVTHFVKMNNHTVKIVLLIAVQGSIISAITYFSSALVSLHKNFLLFKINLLIKLFSLLCLLFCVAKNISFPLIITYWITVNLLFLISVHYIIKKLVPDFRIRFDVKFIKIFIMTSLPLIMASAAEYISLKIDTVFLGAMIGEEAVGFYGASYNVYMASWLLPLAMTKVFFPNFIKIFKKDKKKAFRLLYKYNIVFLLYGIFVGLILYLFSDFLVHLIYGKNFGESGQIVKYFSLSSLFLIINRLYTYTLVALKLNKYYTKLNLASAGINILLNYFFIIQFGILGAVYATIITEIFIFILGYIKIHQVRSSLGA